MKKVRQRKFILYDIIQPMIRNNAIVSCPGVGGIRVKCRLETSLAYKIRIPNWIYRNVRQLQNKKLRYFYIPTISNTKQETKLLYKPYKNNWDTYRNRLSHDKWGKKNHPLTNIWIEIEKDDIVLNGISIPVLKKEIGNNIIRKYLGQLKTFTLYN